MNSTGSRKTWIVVPCGAGKLDQAARAEDLYTGSLFRYILSAAKAEAAAIVGDCEVVILSALHGLVRLDDVLAPYDLKMGAKGSVTAETVARQAAELGMTYDEVAGVFAMLPKAYLEVLDEALRTDDIYVLDIYETAPGMGFQRGVARVMLAA